MPDSRKRVRITNGTNGENGEAARGKHSPMRSPMSSPVTDLLFDQPPGHGQNGQHGAQRGAANGRGARTLPEHDRQRPVYHISIVAEMVETHPQTLRMYERMGLINPQRTRHNIRLYSEADIEQVRRIQHLTQDLGVNLAGVEVVFKLLREMHRLRAEMEDETEENRRKAE